MANKDFFTQFVLCNIYSITSADSCMKQKQKRLNGELKFSHTINQLKHAVRQKEWWAQDGDSKQGKLIIIAIISYITSHCLP